MPKRSEFVDYLVEQLAPLGDVSARGMFGGWGIYLEGRMFALVAEDTLYVKVDDTNRAEFEQAGLHPFRYDAGRSESVISYYTLPTSAIDDRHELCDWARKGVDAASRAAAKKRPRRK